MAEVTKLLYVVVVDDAEKREKGKESFRYTRPVLQSALQLMGCKARHAFKVVPAIPIFFFSLFNVRVVWCGVVLFCKFIILISCICTCDKKKKKFKGYFFMDRSHKTEFAICMLSFGYIYMGGISPRCLFNNFLLIKNGICFL